MPPSMSPNSIPYLAGSEPPSSLSAHDLSPSSQIIPQDQLQEWVQGPTSCFRGSSVKRRAHILGLFFVLVLAIPNFSVGQPAPRGPAAEMQTLFTMDFEQLTTISLASLFEERPELAPSSVYVFKREDILAMGITTIEELANFVPGFQAARDFRNGQGLSIGARGRQSGADPESNDILFLLNGQRLNEDNTGGAIFYLRYYPVGNVKKVEFIRGPGSALYGANAFTGVINIVTDQNLNQLYVANGTPDDFEGYLNVAHDIKDVHMSLFVNGVKDGGESYQFNQGATQDPYSSYDIFATFSTARVALDIRHQARHFEDFILFGFFSDDVNKIMGDDTQITLRGNLIDTDSWDVQMLGTYRRLRSEALVLIADAATMQGLNTMGLTTGTDRFVAGPVNLNDEWRGRLTGTFHGFDDHRLSGGATYRRAKTKTGNQNNYELTEFLDVIVAGNPGTITFYGETIETATAIPDVVRHMVGAYLQDQWQITSDLRATVGGRLDYFDDIGTSVNPRVAVSYQAPYNAFFKALYGEAFRAPNQGDLHVLHSPTNTGNPDLEPESSRTFEVAWFQNLGPAQTGITYYHTTIKNPIIPGTVSTTDLRAQPKNGSSFDLSGLEFELAVNNLFDAVSVKGTLTHLFERATNPKNFPKHTASFIVNYTRQKLTLNLNGYYHGKVQQNATTDLDSYWVLNTTLQYRLFDTLFDELLQNVTVVARVTNLFDKDVRTFTRLSNQPTGTPNRGRNFMIGLRLDFD